MQASKDGVEAVIATTTVRNKERTSFIDPDLLSSTAKDQVAGASVGNTLQIGSPASTLVFCGSALCRKKGMHTKRDGGLKSPGRLKASIPMANDANSRSSNFCAAGSFW